MQYSCKFRNGLTITRSFLLWRSRCLQVKVSKLRGNLVLLRDTAHAWASRAAKLYLPVKTPAALSSGALPSTMCIKVSADPSVKKVTLFV